MATEYAEAGKRAAETNPLRISNFFHVTLGGFNLLMGGLIAFLLTREMVTHWQTVLPSLSIAAGLLLLGMTQVGRAWRDEKFKIHSNDIGGFAVPDKLQGVTNAQALHVCEVLNNGVQPAPTPDNALLKKLYSWIPKLELAPQVIRWHAETQWIRITRLVVTTLGFVLAWIFSRPDVFAWLAPVFLLLALSPATIMRSFRTSRAGEHQLQRPAAPTPHQTVAILLFSVFAPILTALAVPEQLPAPPYEPSTVIVPTVVAILTLLAASALFLGSLKSQTRELTTSGVGHRHRDDLGIANLGKGLIEHIESQLPYPRSVLVRDTGRQSSDSFSAELLVEAEQRLNAGQAHSSAFEAIASECKDPNQRSLVALAAFGCLTGLTAAVLAYLFTRSASVTLLLSALALFAGSQFSLMAAHGLWNRVDFSSTLFRVKYHGTYTKRERTRGNSVTGTGTLKETTWDVDQVKFWVAVAHLETVAFARSGERFVQSVDLKVDRCGNLFDQIGDFYHEIKRRKASAYHEDDVVRGVAHDPSPRLSIENLPQDAAALSAGHASPQEEDV